MNSLNEAIKLLYANHPPCSHKVAYRPGQAPPGHTQGLAELLQAQPKRGMLESSENASAAIIGFDGRRKCVLTLFPGEFELELLPCASPAFGLPLEAYA